MREIEKRIQEKRSIEATKKKLMGFNGKIGCVVRNLGQPIISQAEGGGAFHDYGPELYDPWQMPEDIEQAQSHEDIMKRIPTMQIRDEQGNPIGDPGDHSKEWSEARDRTEYGIDQLGWHFDGLSRGMHLEIKYEENAKSLTVTYQGYKVYEEVAGELMSYVPSQEWEGKVHELYIVAKKIDDDSKKQIKTEEIQEAKKEKDKWWDKTRKKWGL